jgi:uncharacterized protein
LIRLLHFVALFGVLLSLAPGCSYSSHSVSKGNKAPVTQSQVALGNEGDKSESRLPRPTGFVTDYANVIDLESEAELQSLLTELRSKSGIEFAVLTVDSTGGQSIFDYSLAVAKDWGIGPKDASRGGGVLLMLAIKDRQWRIQVSRSLEKDLPDEFCKSLGAQLEASCSQRKYAEGIKTFVADIIRKLQETRGFEIVSPVDFAPKLEMPTRYPVVA